LALYGVYWLGLWVWFHTDDFALLRTAQLPSSEFWPQLLQPRAQGTYRPLSERLFFYSFYHWYGFNAFPYRVLSFGTQIVNLWLFGAIARRITGSLGAAILAACLWALHHGLATAMSWTSAYNQPLSSFFILLSFWLFLRFAENGRISLYLLQWLTFLIGFGALETLVVYPALILAWCIFFRRDRWIWAAAMFAGSAFLAWIQFTTVTTERPDVYALSIDPSDIARTFFFYLKIDFAAYRPAWFAAIIAGPLAAATLYEATQRRFGALFGWAWFAITLAPFLPLAAHLSMYYLFFPSAGLALAASAVAQRYWGANRLWRAPIVLILATWTFVTATTAVDLVADNHLKSIRARNLVGGLAYARARHPNKTLLLVGIDSDFFYSSIQHHLFQVAQLYDVYLAPDGNFIEARPSQESADRYVLSAEDVLLDIRRDSLVVYDASGLQLREVTKQYRALAPLRLQALEKPREQQGESK
jgi:hypothetical protein